MFRKSLVDVVKGIRANKNKEDRFIRHCLSEIQKELTSKDMKVKAEAINKLIYLDMKGYPLNNPFHVIEVIASREFHYKRIGYLAASQSFTQDTNEIMLATQTIRNDLNSANQHQSGLALNCLANICTPQLARDLASEVLGLLNSQRPYVRKKAILVLFRIFLKYPEALRPSFPRIRDRLKDQHQAVISSSVNVICELSRKNPKNYLSMAPVFFRLLQKIKNNWTLIKIIKLFDQLIPHEPRLPKKIKEEIKRIISTTGSKSLQYECLALSTRGLQKHKDVIRLAVSKLKTFVVEKDQNLKYLGLLGLNNLMNKYPKVISSLKEEILKCLEDKDISIRHRAVDLLCGVINKKNVKGIVKKLLKFCTIAEVDDRNFMVFKILQSCSKNNYNAISNFKWYLENLLHFTSMKGIEYGKEISDQIMDILIRVKSMRSWGITQMIELIRNVNEQTSKNTLSEILYGAAYLIGEFFPFYITEMTNEDEMDNANEKINVICDVYKDVISFLLDEKFVSMVPQNALCSFIQCIMKIYSSLCQYSDGTVENEENSTVVVKEEEEEKEVNILSMDDSNNDGVEEKKGEEVKEGEEVKKKRSKDEEILDLLTMSVSVDDDKEKKKEEEEDDEKKKEGEGEEKKDEKKDIDDKKVKDVTINEVISEIRCSIKEGFYKVLEKTNDLESQERICTFLSILNEQERLKTSVNICKQINALFEGDLNPVREGSIYKVPKPEGLDLDNWINEEFVADFTVDEFSFDGFEGMGKSDDHSTIDDPYLADLLPKDAKSEKFDSNNYQKEKSLYILGGGSGGKSKVKHKDISEILNKRGGRRRRGRGGRRRRGGRGGRRRGRGGKRKGKGRKRKIDDEDDDKVYEVSNVIEEPDVVESNKKDENDDENEGNEEKDVLSQIDLTKPVMGDEGELYKVEAYPKKTRVLSEEEKKKKKKEEEEEKKKKKEEDGEKKKKRGGRKGRRGGRRGRGRGRGRRGRRRGGRKGKRVGKRKVLHIKDENEGESKEKGLESVLFDDDSEVEVVKKKKKKNLQSFFEGSESESDSATVKYRKRSLRVKQKLCKNETMRVIYDTRIAQIDATTISIPIMIQNISKVKSDVIESIKYNVIDTNDIKLKRKGSGLGKIDVSNCVLKPGEKKKIQLLLEVEKEDQPRDITGSFYYKVSGDRKIRLRWLLNIPCSYYLVPKQISTDKLRDIISNNQCPYLSSTRCTLSNIFPTIAAATAEICKVLKTVVIQRTPNNTAFNLFAATKRGTLVAIQIKGKQFQKQFNVEIKCSNEKFGKNILKEVFNMINLK